MVTGRRATIPPGEPAEILLDRLFIIEKNEYASHFAGHRTSAQREEADFGRRVLLCK
jgi:hypothetical protein